MCRRPGVSEAALDQAEAQLALKLPPAFRLLWSLHDGQHLQSRRDASSAQAYLFGESLPDEDMQHHPALGLLGGMRLSCAGCLSPGS